METADTKYLPKTWKLIRCRVFETRKIKGNIKLNLKNDILKWCVCCSWLQKDYLYEISSYNLNM